MTPRPGLAISGATASVAAVLALGGTAPGAAAAAGSPPDYWSLLVTAGEQRREATLVTGCLPEVGCDAVELDPPLREVLRVRARATVRLRVAPSRVAEVVVERGTSGRPVGRARLRGDGTATTRPTYRLPAGTRSGDVLRVFVRYAPVGHAVFRLRLSVAGER